MGDVKTNIDSDFCSDDYFGLDMVLGQEYVEAYCGDIINQADLVSEGVFQETANDSVSQLLVDSARAAERAGVKTMFSDSEEQKEFSLSGLLSDAAGYGVSLVLAKGVNYYLGDAPVEDVEEPGVIDMATELASGVVDVVTYGAEYLSGLVEEDSEMNFVEESDSEDDFYSEEYDDEEGFCEEDSPEMSVDEGAVYTDEETLWYEDFSEGEPSVVVPEETSAKWYEEEPVSVQTDGVYEPEEEGASEKKVSHESYEQSEPVVAREYAPPVQTRTYSASHPGRLVKRTITELSDSSDQEEDVMTEEPVEEQQTTVVAQQAEMKKTESLETVMAVGFVDKNEDNKSTEAVLEVDTVSSEEAAMSVVPVAVDNPELKKEVSHEEVVGVVSVNENNNSFAFADTSILFDYSAENMTGAGVVSDTGTGLRFVMDTSYGAQGQELYFQSASESEGQELLSSAQSFLAGSDHTADITTESFESERESQKRTFRKKQQQLDLNDYNNNEGFSQVAFEQTDSGAVVTDMLGFGHVIVVAPYGALLCFTPRNAQARSVVDRSLYDAATARRAQTVAGNTASTGGGMQQGQDQGSGRDLARVVAQQKKSVAHQSTVLEDDYEPLDVFMLGARSTVV